MMNHGLLVATNGLECTWAGVAYAAWLGKTMKAPVTLIGITEQIPALNTEDEIHPLEEIFNRAAALFKEHSLDYNLEIHEGPAEEIISKKSREKDFLTILSPLGRPPLRRLLLGRSFRGLMADISGPLLYIPQDCSPPSRVLICLGGLGYGITAEDLGLQIASQIKVPVTLLHVVPPIDLDYPEAREVRDNWEHLLDTETLLGRTLRQALEIAREEKQEAQLKVRQGNVVEEILSELKESEYGLVCMGSPYSVHGLRQFYAPNVTAEVAEDAGCPVLTVRFEE